MEAPAFPLVIGCIREANIRMLLRKGAEDRNSADCKNDDHRNRNAGAIANFGRHVEPKKSPADKAVMGLCRPGKTPLGTQE